MTTVAQPVASRQRVLGRNDRRSNRLRGELRDLFTDAPAWAEFNPKRLRAATCVYLQSHSSGQAKPLFLTKPIFALSLLIRKSRRFMMG
jgi:hypothetical protein